MFQNAIILLFIASIFIGLEISNGFKIESTGECVHVVYLPKHQVSFGTQLRIYERRLCFEACLNDSSCISFDWDFANPGCFVFSKFEASLIDNIGVDHYFFLRNQSDCQGTNRNYTWIPLINATWAGKSKVVVSKHLGDCVEMCLADDICSGVDWISNNTVCTLNFGRGDIINSSDSIHYDRPYFKPPQETRHLKSALALKAEYIIIIALGLGAIVLTTIAVVLLCMYRLKRPTKTEDRGFYENSGAGIPVSLDTDTKLQDVTPAKSDLNNYTYRSIDYKNSKEAITVETVHENDQIF